MFGKSTGEYNISYMSTLRQLTVSPIINRELKYEIRLSEYPLNI